MASQILGGPWGRDGRYGGGHRVRLDRKDCFSPDLFSFISFSLLSECTHRCPYRCLPTKARGQCLIAQELELHRIVSCLMWVLGPKFQFSAEAASAFNC